MIGDRETERIIKRLHDDLMGLPKQTWRRKEMAPVMKWLEEAYAVEINKLNVDDTYRIIVKIIDSLNYVKHRNDYKNALKSRYRKLS